MLLLYRDGLQITDITDTSDKHIEHLCVDVHNGKRSNTKAHRFCCFYNAPISSQKIRTQGEPASSKDLVVKLCSSMKRYIHDCPIFILGDFNMPQINWSTLTASSSYKHAQYFLDFCLSNNLDQYVTESTHSSGSTLDLVFANPLASNHIINCEVLAPVSSTCDHNLISLTCTIAPESSFKLKRQFLCYNRGNYDAINQCLSVVDWDALFVAHNFCVQSVYDEFLSILHDLFEKFIPRRSCSSNRSTNTKLKKLAREKSALYKECKKDNSLKEKYKNLSKRYEKEVHAYHENIESNLCNSSNISSFYKYANSKLRMHSSIPVITSDDGTLHKTNMEKANHFNEVFQSVFTRDNGVPLSIPSKSEVLMDKIVISEEMLLRVIHNMDPKTSLTPDDLPAKVIKMIAPQIKHFLKRFFQLSLDTGVLPQQWKKAVVSPIHKKSSKNIAKNYRPISLTSCICRILEAIIKNVIIEYLFAQNLLSKHQHGFLPGRGTTTQLLHSLNNWSASFDNNEAVDIVYTDFSKAFDTVSHAKLVEVLRAFGIRGTTLSWLKEFLSNRVQRVMINGDLSDPLDVLSGVPQGSVLGPLLFILFIDDINHCCEDDCNIGLYADDSKIYSKNPPALQRTLHQVNDFINDRQLVLAAEKCKHLTISKKATDSTFDINNVSILKCESVIDLGIKFSSNLKWKPHCLDVKIRGARRCYQILRSFRSKCIWTLLRAYTTYVRPTLESNTVVWSPYLKEDVNAIESVQWRFIKAICRRCNIRANSYHKRLELLNIKTLEYRRCSFDLIMVYKIIHGLVDVPFREQFSFYASPYNLRNHEYTLKRESYSSDERKNFFSNRVIPIWNRLPDRIVSSPSLSSFKFRLKSFDLRTVKKMVV